MRKIPIYGFDDVGSVGIDKVPNYSQVTIEDDGSGKTKMIIKVSGVGLNSGSTIQDFLNIPSLYQDLYQFNPIQQTVDPTINDDETKGYKAGQIIVNTSTNKVFILSNSATGSAVWYEVQSQSDLDAQYVKKSGDTMTGTLNVPTINGTRVDCGSF